MNDYVKAIKDSIVSGFPGSFLVQYTKEVNHTNLVKDYLKVNKGKGVIYYTSDKNKAKDLVEPNWWATTNPYHWITDNGCWLHIVETGDEVMTKKANLLVVDNVKGKPVLVLPFYNRLVSQLVLEGSSQFVATTEQSLVTWIKTAKLCEYHFII